MTVVGSQAIQIILERIYGTGLITRTDQQELTRLLLSDAYLSWEDYQKISQILDRLDKGFFKVANEDL